MAMTLRLTAEQDAALTLLANSLGVSKQEAATRAIVEKAARTVRSAELQELARREVASYAALHGRVRRGR
ncbi:CopG family transcriptional regulator [Corynebacterium hindlerae]|nr:CopG family transcriptional regulator [Corynebacterium hindlerae]QTH59816.1 CopG family transcriptional regulator [Corynebacterium hindlerae]